MMPIPIFWKSNIIRFSGLISLCNCLFIYKQFLVRLLQFFPMFSFKHPIHMNKTLGLRHMVFLIKPRCNTSKYGTNAFIAFAIASWNFFQKEFPSNNVRQISYSQLKVLIKNYFFNSYNQISVEKYRWFLCLRLFHKT